MILFDKLAIGWSVAAAVGCAIPAGAFAQQPQGYPADYAEIVAAAETEGSVVIYANTEHAAVEPILADFQEGIPEDPRRLYRDQGGRPVQATCVSSEAAAGALKADMVWSSAMDLQYQMVEDVNRCRLCLAGKPAVPSWSNWGDKIYGITFEPVVMVYNSKIVSSDEMPDTRAGLATWLTGKTGTA